MRAHQRYEFPVHSAAPWRERSWDRLRSRLLAAALDRHLAAGRPPRSSQALAIRAREIVSSAVRQELARRWINVLDQASRPPVPRSGRAPLRRDAITATAADLRAMISVLASGCVIEARGAAMARLLLTDGTGPLYNHRSPADLGAIVREATRRMNSSAARQAG